MRWALAYAGIRKPTGFTLIELLIVVAILGILAAIAVPRFQCARVKAQFTHMVGEPTRLKDAMTAYYLDYGTHIHGFATRIRYRPLTTPVAYLTKEPLDIYKIDAYKREDLDKPLWNLISWNPYSQGRQYSWEGIALGRQYFGRAVGRLISFGPAGTIAGIAWI